MNTSLISIIIPVYNVQKYLHECMSSVLRQTYSNLEIILVNDGSTDSSPAICDEYAQKDNRVRVIHKANGGISDARNAGFKVVTGEYVYFLDSDDYISCTAMEDCVVVIEQEQADFVFFDAITFSVDTAGRHRYRPNYMRRQAYAADAGYKVLSRLMDSDEYWPAPWFNLVSAKCIREHNILFDSEILGGVEDCLYTALLYLRANRVSHINKPLIYYRNHKSSISNDQKPIERFIGYTIVCYELLKEYQSKTDVLQMQKQKRRLVLDIFKTAMQCFYRLHLNQRIMVASNKKDICLHMKTVRYMNDPTAYLYAFRITHLWLKQIGIAKWRIAHFLSRCRRYKV